MNVRCPGCSQILAIAAGSAGKVVRCGCGTQLRAPMSAAAPQSTPQSTPQSPTPRKGSPARTGSPARPNAMQGIAGGARSRSPVASAAAHAASGRAFAVQSALPTSNWMDDLTEADLQPIRPVAIPGREMVRPKASTDKHLAAQAGQMEKEEAKRQKAIKAGAQKWLLKSVGLLAFLGVIRTLVFSYLLYNAEEEVLGLPPTDMEMSTLLWFVRAYYAMHLGIAIIMCLCAAGIFFFPVTCGITAMVVWILSELLGLIVNPLALFSIGGWIGRAAVFGMLTQVINNAGYYRFVKQGGRN